MDEEIWMVAPFPFYRDRGSCFNVYNKLKALTNMGYRVRLFTYGEGESKQIEKVSYERVTKLPGRTPIGISAHKIIYDFLIYRNLTKRLKEIDQLPLFLHSHEIDGTVISIISRREANADVPLVYDMHSVLSERLKDELPWYPKWIAKKIERLSYEESDIILTISPAFKSQIREFSDKTEDEIRFIPDIPALEEEEIKPQIVESIKREANGKRIVLYMGTLQKYQGIGILLKAFSKLDKNAYLFLVGEENKSLISKTQKMIESLDLNSAVIEDSSVENMPSYLYAADAVVSPRKGGTNIPFKLYPYMKSEKPIVATDIPAHSILEDGKDSVLCSPTPKKMSEEIEKILSRSELREKIAKNARRKYKEKFNRKAYRRGLEKAVERVIGRQ